jgi:hypothetical protein
MHQQGSCASAFRRLALIVAVVFAIAAVVGPASAKPGNGNGNGPPAGDPNGNANGHSNGNAGGNAGAQSNRGGNPGNNGRRVRAHGNPTHNASPGNGSSGQSSGNNGRRAHGAPSRGSRGSGGSGGGGVVKQPGSRGNGGKKGAKENNGVPHQKETICHATGSETNPYVEITISVRAIKAHDRHQNDEDIIPAPAGGCPGQQAAANPESPGSNAAEVLTALGAPLPPLAPSPTAAETPAGGVADESASAGPRVLGAQEQGGTEPAAAAEPTAAADEPDEEESSGSLPFTGLELLILGAIGVALLLAGIAGRRAFIARA